MKAFLRTFAADESAQATTEYGLLVAAVVVLTILAGVIFSDDVSALFQAIGDYINGG